MRRTILGVAVITVCGAIQIAAQQTTPQPRPPLLSLPRPHSHPPPRPANAPPTPVAVFDAGNLGSPLLLDKGWRVGITSDLSAAMPDFDDSNWAVRNAQGTFADVPDVDQPANDPDLNAKSGPDSNTGRPSGRRRRYAWFRLHLKLPANHGPVSVLIELPVSETVSMTLGTTGPGVDVFANGRQIHPEGPHGDAPEHYEQISRIYDLNLAPSDASLILVLRTVYVPFGLEAYTAFFAHRNLRLGYREDLDRALQLWLARSIFERLPPLVDSILLTVLALFLLALYFTQEGHIEYLLLALHELLQAPIGFVELAGGSAWLDSLWYVALVLQLVAVSAYLYFEFLIAFLALPRRWYIFLLRITAPILLGLGPTLLLVGHSSAVGIVLAIVFLGSFLWIAGWFIFIFATLISATVHRNFEAGLLLIPLVLSLVGIVEPVLTASMGSMGFRAYHSPLTLQAGPIPIHFASIADFAGILAIVLIIFIRFLRVQRDQERASSELAAARSVQDLMIPHEKIETPGFEVDSVYNPANEVGGDFFHLQMTPDGGLLVVLGDVAGKGLKAAMNVSMLMGALRRTPERSPAKILEALNRVLTGSESFTTCQAAWFGANGELVLANAGHLPPYLNSQEITLPGGLPLGVLFDNTYEEVRLFLHPGDRILMMSDGVVEARQATGELFGFDRIHNMSNQSAFYIAEAAKAFGQDDDITVLTVRRLGQAMAA